jgi:hypothetical protein
MKNFLVLFAAGVVLLTGCILSGKDDDKVQTGDGNPLAGNWIIVKTEYVSGGQTYTENYDPNSDNYANAEITTITANLMIDYTNGPGTSYMADTVTYVLSGNQVIRQESGTSDTATYSFSGSQLVVEITESGNIARMFFNRYTGGNDPSLIGKWILVQQDNTSQGQTETVTYDPNSDNYLSALIVDFTGGTVISYQNSSGSEYSEDPSSYTTSGNIFISYYYDPYDGSYDTDTMTYSIAGGQLIVEQTDPYGEGSTKMYFNRYTGTIPPASWTVGVSNDNFEPDNDMASANTLMVGASEVTHMIVANDVDYYSFSATTGNSYLIIVTGFMDNVLTLYDASGSELAYDDDNDMGLDVGVPNLESVILRTCTTSGTYYASVGGWSPSDEGSYAISVQSSITAVAKRGASNSDAENLPNPWYKRGVKKNK